MKEDNLDKRIERVTESVGSKLAAMRQWESDRIAAMARRKKTIKRWRIYGISAAASVIVICGVGIGILFNGGGSNFQGVSSLENTSMAPVYRGGCCDVSEIQAMIDSARYEPALWAIDATLADTVIAPSFTPERQEYLRSLNANREYELVWLKINVFVKTGKNGEAIRLLREYVETEGEHQTEARKLLNNLER